MQRRDFLAGLAAGATWLPLGCKPHPAIETVEYPAPRVETANRLVVMFPGMGDLPEAYAEHGFVGLLPRARVDADVVVVNAHLRYYIDRDLVSSVRAGVIEPARQRGYTSIWMLGTSMGGLGALLATREFADDVDGVVLLSPFLGKRKTIEAVTAAGAPERWALPPPSDAPKDYTAELWRWLQGYAIDPATRPAMYFGYGTKEAGPPYAALAGLLPEHHVHVVEGGHGWPTWEAIFPTLVARGAFGG